MKRMLGLLLTAVLLMSLGTAASGDAAEPEMLHVCDENNNERCLAASADGTRFLIWQNHHPEHNMWVQDADGGNRRDLYFSGLEEEQAESIAGLALISSVKLKSEQVAPELEKWKQQYGSAVSALMHCIWQQPRANLASVAGDMLLLTDYAFGSARINMETGETALLNRVNAVMGPDGAVFCYYASERKAWYLPVDQAVPEEIPFPWPSDVIIMAACPLSDGTVWILEHGYMDAVEQDNRKIFPVTVSLVLRDRTGKELRRVEGGAFDHAVQPTRLLYSEATGIGILFCDGFSPIQQLWYFGPEDENLKALLPAGFMIPGLPAAQLLSREESVDEYGFPLASGRIQIPIGLTADGRKLLFLDVESNSLMALNLETLEGELLLNGTQIVSLLGVDPAAPRQPGPMDFMNMGWNGNSIFSCTGAVPGYALRLPVSGE